MEWCSPTACGMEVVPTWACASWRNRDKTKIHMRPESEGHSGDQDEGEGEGEIHVKTKSVRWGQCRPNLIIGVNADRI